MRPVISECLQKRPTRPARLNRGCTSFPGIPAFFHAPPAAKSTRVKIPQNSPHFRPIQHTDLLSLSGKTSHPTLCFSPPSTLACVCAVVVGVSGVRGRLLGGRPALKEAESTLSPIHNDIALRPPHNLFFFLGYLGPPRTHSHSFLCLFRAPCERQRKECVIFYL